MMMWRLVFSALLFFQPSASAQDDMQQKLQNIVQVLASQYNTSISFGVKLDSGEEAIGASGVQPHFSTASLVPGGSATKPLTAISLLRLADAGLLDLDAPITDIIDPWHKKQEPPLPPLREIFSDVANLSKVTTKLLIGMKSGIQDYDNQGMIDWTLQNPDKDYLPIHYITDVGKKPFAFKAGNSVQYSSNGYVLAGMVLAAVSNASTWKDLDQLAALGLVDGEKLQHTIFMQQGRCSKYPGVTHQYGYRRYRPHAERLMEEGGTCAAASGQMKHVRVVGDVLRSFPSPSYEDCCEKSSKTSGVVFVFENRNCTVLRTAQKGKFSILASSGFPVRPFNESDVIDLYDYSCLNGWTMGNIALAPIDAAKVWHALFVKKSMLKPASLALMLDFTQISGGWGRGMLYGHGLMSQPINMRVNGTCGPPLCICSVGQCKLNATQIGHLGADWGSAMPFNGHIPQLGASIAITQTAVFSGMNSSLSMRENQIFGQLLQCHMLQVLYQHQFTGFPGFGCPALSGLEDSSLAPPSIVV